MFASTFLFASMHASIRHVSATIHPFEIAFFRSLFALVVVLPWFLRLGLEPLRTRRLGLHAARAAFNVFAMLSFFYALSIAPLSEVTGARLHGADLREPAGGAGARRDRAAAPLDRDRGRFRGRFDHPAPGLRAGRARPAAGPVFVADLGLRAIGDQDAQPDRFQRHDHQLHGALDDPFDPDPGVVRLALAGGRAAALGWS